MVTNYHKAGGLIHQDCANGQQGGSFWKLRGSVSHLSPASGAADHPWVPGVWTHQSSLQRGLSHGLVVSVSSVSLCPNVLSLVKTPLTGSGLTLAHYNLILI